MPGLIKKKIFLKAGAVFLCALFILFLQAACRPRSGTESGKNFKNTQKELFRLLEKTSENTELRFSVINQIAANYRNENKENELTLFLTDYVKKYPNDKYNAYWLLLTAYIYQKKGADPIAELYFERIIKNYDDLSIQDKSIHILCLQNLVQISTSPENRIDYFNQLITHFPDKINKTELYMRLALEYEKMGEWRKTLPKFKFRTFPMHMHGRVNWSILTIHRKTGPLKVWPLWKARSKKQFRLRISVHWTDTAQK